MPTLKTKKQFSDLLPPLQPEEFAALEASILAEGCKVPLTVWNGVIVDGHNRYAICSKHDIPFEIEEKDFPDNDAAADWIDANQLARRNLWPDAFKEALGRRYNREKKKRGRPKQMDQNDPISSESTAQALAKEHGVSEGTVKRAGKFAEEVEADPELKEAVRSNNPAKVRDVQRAKKRAERTEQIAETSKANEELETSKTYPVIYADPPWRYEHTKTDNRKIENQYPTMALDEICALPVGDLATDDAILFLWTTSPKLAESLTVLEAWGFVYRTCAVWDKQKIGMGYYFRQQHELLLVGTCGEIPVPKPANRKSSVFSIRRGKHSEKPIEFAKLIETMYPEFEKVELFARKPRKGWAVWGNQSGA